MNLPKICFGILGAGGYGLISWQGVSFVYFQACVYCPVSPFSFSSVLYKISALYTGARAASDILPVPFRLIYC